MQNKQQIDEKVHDVHIITSKGINIAIDGIPESELIYIIERLGETKPPNQTTGKGQCERGEFAFQLSPYGTMISVKRDRGYMLERNPDEYSVVEVVFSSGNSGSVVLPKIIAKERALALSDIDLSPDGTWRLSGKDGFGNPYYIGIQNEEAILSVVNYRAYRKKTVLL